MSLLLSSWPGKPVSIPIGKLCAFRKFALVLPGSEGRLCCNLAAELGCGNMSLSGTLAFECVVDRSRDWILSESDITGNGRLYSLLTKNRKT